MTTILIKGSQIGASQAGLVFILYCIAVGGPTLVVAPTIAMAELYSKQRLDPIIDGCAPARAKIPPNRGKNSGNTLRLKTFPGGMVRMTGANSANALKSMPAKNAIYEEPDEFVADLQGQGNAVEMTRRRLTNYGRRAKEFANCTPTLSSKTIIHPLSTWAGTSASTACRAPMAAGTRRSSPRSSSGSRRASPRPPISSARTRSAASPSWRPGTRQR
ncbi:hypothetical protein ASF36_22630 [Methylobacterium sp. Leaf90]|nr:hypothetical protein ASF36_22630 [Methylobacterium sp. Leaf90]